MLIFSRPFKNWQSDSVHSGSISFGRFENEPLSWERRSSFSHNRYLEEVEKFSKPGSVNEKKAYFEAHFKKKMLSLEQTGMENQNDERDLAESTDYSEEMQLASKDSYLGHFDGSPVSSEYSGGESKVRNIQVEETRTAEIPIEIDVITDIVPAEVCVEKGIITEQRPGGDEKELEIALEVISLFQNNDTMETISITERSHPSPKVWNEFN